MAERWSLKEDYIVCKYSYAHNWGCLSSEELHCLMSELKESGFASRSLQAVDKRARDYRLLFSGYEAPHIAEQAKWICKSFLEMADNTRLIKNIRTYVAEMYQPNIETDDVINPAMINTCGGRKELAHFTTYKVDFDSTFPMILQKYIDAKGFKKHKDIYDKISMKADTFSAILRGKYAVVKKENVLRLCIGLHLTIDEAEEFMESAGYLFSRAIMTDVVIKACIIQKCYNPIVIDTVLYENKAPSLFSLA